ncbi:MAG: response regulator [Anaerolineae bacterium]|nr:response regulator [Anaerolineae bacterium]
MANNTQPVAQQRSRLTIGMVCDDSSSKYAELIWNGVRSVVQRRGANLLLFRGGLPNPVGEQQPAASVLYDLISAETLDGIVIWGAQLSHAGGVEVVTDLCRRYASMPIVNIGLTLPDVSNVLVDNYQGMHDVVEHLVAVHGRKRIAFLHGPEANPEAQDRYRGYVDALTEHGIPIDPEIVAPWDAINAWRLRMPQYHEENYHAAGLHVLMQERHLRPKEDFDAVVGNDDTMGIGSLYILRTNGFRVPEDVAVVSFDDIPQANYMTPPLTTVRQSFFDLGRQAGEMLLDRITGKVTTDIQVVLPMQVVVRRSCGCADPAVLQTEMDSVPAPSGKVNLRAKRGEVTAILVQALGLPDKHPLTGRIGALLDVFLDELTHTAQRGAFMIALEDILQDVFLEESHLQTFQMMISTLRRQMWPNLQKDTHLQAETLLHQARIAIGAAMYRAQAYQVLRLQLHEQDLREVGAALLTTFDMDALLDVLGWGLPRLNVSGAYMSLYKNPAEPATSARLIFASNGHTHLDVDPEKRQFSSRQLMPAELWPQDAQYSMIVEPFYFQNEQLGFALFETGEAGLAIFRALRGEISSALKGALLFQEHAQAEAALEQRAAELVAAKELTEKALQQTEVEKERTEKARLAAEEARRISESARDAAEIARRTAEKAQRDAEAANAALEAQIWHTTGHAQINNRMRGEQDVLTLADNVIEQLCEYLTAQVGVLYVREDDILCRVGSYACSREEIGSRFKIGEGLLGQAVHSKKPIFLTDIPADYTQIASGLGSAAPKAVVIMPFLYDDQVVGVVELGRLAAFSAEHMKFLQTALESIAIAFNTAQARARINQLLTQTQQQAEELQAQGEALRVANEELESQTENLRVSGARLREQQTELESANAELIQKQKQLDQQNRELREAQMDLEYKAEELARASQYKSEFLANMSHELRTPLNSLLILARMLANNDEGNLKPEQIESATIIYNSGNDLLKLINEILDLSKVEAGKMSFHFESVSLSGILEAMRVQFAHVAEEKKLAFNLSVDDTAPERIETDLLRVEQILKNLLSNAFKFTDQGSVSLGVGLPSRNTKFSRSGLDPERTVAFCVTDTGIGMTPEQQKIVFEAFQQADGSTSRKYGGTGLGLTISRELASHLGGEIALKSEYGKGSSFILYLPFKGQLPASAHETAVATRRREAPEKGKKGDRGRRESREKTGGGEDAPSSEEVAPIALPAPELERPAVSIPDDRDSFADGDRVLLIVEDDANFAKIVRDYARKKGFKCLVSGDGQTGLELAKKYLPNAIILDLNLPVIDGREVLEVLKSEPATRHIPVHVMSVADEDVSIYKQGAIGFLTKPVSPEALEASFQNIEQFIAREIKSLLVVEDDTNLRHSVTKLLSGNDIQIVEAGTGKAATKALKSQLFDCMILDLNLPDMSGFDLLAQLDRSEMGLRCPIIIYTGKELTPDENRQLLQYADADAQPLRVIVKGVRSPERLLDETALFLHRVVANMPEDKQKTIRQLHNQEAILTGKRILLADDDARSAFALSKLLADKGVKVAIAYNGVKALEMLEQNEYDLILMDIMMPEMDGYETIKRIRQQGKYYDLPILALTAKAMKGDRERCIEAGANDYLPKPVEADRLFSMLRVWLYR